MRKTGWLLTSMMLLYAVHAFIVVRADQEFARQHPASQFNLRTLVIHDTVFGWAGAWGAALGVVWLAVASGLWVYYLLTGRHLSRNSRRSLIAVLVGLLIVAGALVVETISKGGVG